jgi:TonB-linked SusC/RagA family outer membrane protein
MKNLNLLILTLLTVSTCFGQELTGRVLSATGQQPLYGATIKLTGTPRSTGTDAHGYFRIRSAVPLLLEITYTGFEKRVVPVAPPFKDTLTILLQPANGRLEAVTVSTGYQQLSRERVTGSFVQLDSALLDRRVSTGLLARLQDVTSGLIFNQNVPGRVNDISIRGQATIFGNSQPLIVLDNFPYDGDVNDINPADVESITVLKDAAAAAIWGARAGNGVIVVTTKKGKFNQPVKVSFSATTTVGNKPDLFYASRISSADFISVEQQLFAKGYYTYTEQSPDHEPLDPAVEVMIAQRNGTLTPAQAAAQLSALGAHDDRSDFSRYFYQQSLNQQYHFDLSGGSATEQYFLSGGYDANRDNLVRNGYTRATVSASHTNAFWNHKLELRTGLYYTGSRTVQDNPGMNGIYGYQSYPLYPYASLADAAGNPQTVTKDYRASFVQAAPQAGLLDWTYSPLADLQAADNYTSVHDLRLNAGLTYKLAAGLAAGILYQYEYSNSGTYNLQSQDSYYTRNLINQFTQVNPDGSLTREIPLGAILDQSSQTAVTQNFRAQLNYDHTWADRHQLTAIAGYEVKDVETTGSAHRTYGYDPTHLTGTTVDYVDPFNQYYYPGYSLPVPYNDSGLGLVDRFVSYYANAAYTYDRRIILSGSARQDQSNLFGVNANQQGVPLWSAGAAWNISQESFYHLGWLPQLKLRATYGYNGNVNKSITAYTTAIYISGSSSITNLPYAQVTNPPNPDLRWERDRIINFGLDFSALGGRLTGTLEYYLKAGLDLTGTTPYPPSTGISSFYGNDAATKGRGADLTLNSRNLDGRFKWTSTLLASYAHDEVTKYDQPPGATSLLTFGYGSIPEPVAGKPLDAIYSYRWAGLDPQTGAPRAYLNGAVSENYAQLVSTATPANLVYNGPSRPQVFGSLRNTFSYGGWSLSAILSYRLGYYFRQPSVNYTNLLNGRLTTGDFGQRWQQPGDELHTNVPSMPATTDLNRDNVYLYSSALVQKGDNIRLQDVNLSCRVNRHWTMLAYADNLGLLWKANKAGLDPDYLTLKLPVTLSLGLRLNL